MFVAMPIPSLTASTHFFPDAGLYKLTLLPMTSSGDVWLHASENSVTLGKEGYVQSFTMPRESFDKLIEAYLQHGFRVIASEDIRDMLVGEKKI